MDYTNRPDHTEAMLRIFEELPDYYLILSKELKIITASNAYVKLTGKSREQMFDKYLLDVFPQHVNNDDDGEILTSLKHVLNTKRAHAVNVTRFDAPDMHGHVRERHWKTSHTPVLNPNGEIDYIIHKTIEVTDATMAERKLLRTIETEKRAAANANRLRQQMERLFEDIPAQIAIVSGPDMVYDYINPQYEKELFPNRNILGLPLHVALPEVIGSPIYNILYKVYNTGKTHKENEICIQLADRPGEQPIDHYFNLVYQPLKDDGGNITGVISFKYEVTELVKARKKLEENEQDLYHINEELAQANKEIIASNEKLLITNEELKQTHRSLIDMAQQLEDRVKMRTTELMWSQKETEAQRDVLRRLFMQAPAGICIFNGPDFVYELINPPYQELVPKRELLGKPLFEALPELKGQPVENIIREVYDTGKTYEGIELNVPLINEDGKLEDRYFNFIYQARYNAAQKIDGIMVYAFDVTEMVLNRKREQANENRFRFLLNAIPQQVWTAKPDGTLDYVNEVVSADFGDNADKVVSNGWQKYVHPDDLVPYLKKWVSSLQNNEEYLVEFRLKFADGQYHWHLGRAVPLIENGQISMWLGTNTNIDIQKNNEQKKDEFLSIASHELKTPLTSIKAFNQLMGRINDPEKVKGFINKSTQHISRLEKLITDLLDVTRINAGKMRYDMQPFNFGQMVKESIESAQLAAPDHHIVLQANADIEFTGDRLRLEQVINNFLNNAVKYSPNGKQIIVNSKLEQDSLVVSVQDFGIGIEQQHLSQLFDRYYRIDNTAMRFEGLGLGLYISADILKRHYGSFWIESEINKGSTFYFRLPVTHTKISVELSNIPLTHEYAEISYNAVKNWIEANWKGFQTIETIQNGCLSMLPLIASHPTKYILNDNTLVQGSWSEASEWVGKEFFPILEKAGVSHIAWIYSSSAFSQLAAQKTANVAIGNIITQFFTDRKSAEKWLTDLAD